MDEVKSLCPCGSGSTMSECCGTYFSMLGISDQLTDEETSLLGWLEMYSSPIAIAFLNKTRTYLFRLSSYLDKIVYKYFPIGFRCVPQSQNRVDKVIFSIKNNVLNSLLGALSCLSQGLFIQSGVLIRSAVEDCLVLLDIFENNGQMDRLLNGKYSANEVLARVKRIVPAGMVGWYGYFSANFTHFGPLHRAPYAPAACYPDNYVLVIGFQNMMRAVVSFHLVLERVHFEQTEEPMLWHRPEDQSQIIFKENSVVFEWTERLGKELIDRFPPDERKDGFFYDSESYHTK